MTLGTHQSPSLPHLSVLGPLHTTIYMAEREAFLSMLSKLHPSADDSMYCEAHVSPCPRDNVDTNT